MGGGGGSVGGGELVFTGTVSRISAGACTQFTVARQDGTGAAWPVSGSDELINLLSDTAGVPAQFFPDAACRGTPVSAATMAVGSATATFFVEGRTAGIATLSASRTGLTTASRVVTIAPGTPVKLVLFGPLSTPTSAAGTCSPPVTLQLRDAFDNPSPALSPVAVMLSSTASGPLTFSPVSNCVGVTSSVTIPVLSSEAQFHFRADRAESVTLTGSALNFSPLSLLWVVTPGPPSKLGFKSGAPALIPFTCGGIPLTVQVQDALGNPTTFTGNRTFEFLSGNAQVGMLFSDSQGCSQVLGSPAENRYTSPGEFTVYLLPRAPGMTSISVRDNTLPPLASTPGLVVTSTGTAGSVVLSSVNGTNQIEYGGCLEVRAQRFKSGGPFPWTVGTTVLNLSGGTADLTLHADSACSLAASSVTIPDGASTTTAFYVKGHSAPALSSSNFVATDAAAVFPSASMALSALPLVRRGQCNLMAGAVSCSLTTNAPAIPMNDISRTLLMFQARGSALSGSEGSVDCHLTSSGSGVTVDCRRYAAFGFPQTIFWQTASWAKPVAAGGVSVAHRTVNFSGTGSTLNDPHMVPLVPSDLDRTFLVFSAAGPDTGFSAPSFPIGYLGATNTVTLSASSNIPFGSSISYQLVQMSGLTVDRGFVPSPGFMNSFSVINLLDRGLGAAFLHTMFFGSTGDTPDVCRKRARGTIPSATTLSLVRGDPDGGVCANVPPSTVVYERLSFAGTLASVQSATLTVPAGSPTSIDATLPTGVAPDRTLLFLSGQGPAGQASGETASTLNNLGIATAALAFNGSGALRTQVAVSRGDTSGPAAFSLFAVQFAK